MGSNPGMRAAIQFPDFSRIRIRRPASDFKSWQEHPIDLTPALKWSQCTNNPVLQWGDVVEIPEDNHLLNEMWSGLNEPELDLLSKCLARKVVIKVQDASKEVELPMGIKRALGVGQQVELETKSFWLRTVLLNSRLLLASSDLSGVKVHRVVGDNALDFAVDCSDEKAPPAFWVRDGDYIEVPER